MKVSEENKKVMWNILIWLTFGWPILICIMVIAAILFESGKIFAMWIAMAVTLWIIATALHEASKERNWHYY